MHGSSNDTSGLGIFEGSVVRLNSGGPKMTVMSIAGEMMLCQWFDRNGKMHKAEFARANLSVFSPQY